MNNMSMYKTKKKRAVDPNAPPRPTLLGHEKVLKDARIATEIQNKQVQTLTHRVEELERKLSNQTAYLSALHSTVASKIRS